VAGIRERRIAGSVSENSKKAYGTGAKRWCKEALEKGYEWFLAGKDVQYDLICILHFIDRCAADEGLVPDTVAGYFTGAKTFLRFQGCSSAALGEGKEHHPTVSRALQSVRLEWSESGKPASRKTRRLAVPASVVSIARSSEVPRVVYVAVVIGRGLLLRCCEYVCPSTGVLSKHLLSWEHLQFFWDGKKLVGEDVCEVMADKVSIVHTSRKWQMVGRTRPVPDRVRVWQGMPWQGLFEETRGCVVAVLQAWCIATKGWLNPLHPVCSEGKGLPVLSVNDVNRCLKQWAVEMGMDPEAVESHCLRHGGISDLLDEGVDVEDVRQAAGSKTTAAIVPYIHPGARAANAVSNALSRAVVGSSSGTVG
jgi:hypothetical protein